MGEKKLEFEIRKTELPEIQIRKTRLNSRTFSTIMQRTLSDIASPFEERDAPERNSALEILPRLYGELPKGPKGPRSSKRLGGSSPQLLKLLGSSPQLLNRLEPSDSPKLTSCSGNNERSGSDLSLESDTRSSQAMTLTPATISKVRQTIIEDLKSSPRDSPKLKLVRHSNGVI